VPQKGFLARARVLLNGLQDSSGRKIVFSHRIVFKISHRIVFKISHRIVFK